MNIRVHYPQTEEGMKELQERIDTMYADIVIGNINRLDCTREKKLEIFNHVKNSIRDTR